jgi:hypothetical protein
VEGVQVDELITAEEVQSDELINAEGVQSDELIIVWRESRQRELTSIEGFQSDGNDSCIDHA